MKFYYLLPTALIGVSAALVQSQLALALSSQELSKIAAQITVLIESRNSPGFGVIITRANLLPLCIKYTLVFHLTPKSTKLYQRTTTAAKRISDSSASIYHRCKRDRSFKFSNNEVVLIKFLLSTVSDIL